MKKYSLAFSLLFLSIFLAIFSCKKINEATVLGGDLIPEVDNINTFEVALEAKTNNALFNDTTRMLFSDNVAIGHLRDPEFGQTTADAYFRISSSSYGTYPFLIDRTKPNYLDSLIIDSVVLSLAYKGAYGDTNSTQTVRVFEIASTAGFNDTTLYNFNPQPTGTLDTKPVELGSKTFQIKDLNDTFLFARRRDTARLVNVLRFKLNNATNFVKTIAGFDTAKVVNGGFASDSIFKRLVKGLAVKSDAQGGNGGLAYFSLGDVNTKMTVYFQARKNGTRDTSSFDFIHITNGQANEIKRDRTGTPVYNTIVTTNGTAADSTSIYIESSPGSYASIKIPALDSFKNKLVHRAEIIATRIPSTADNFFTAPSRLFLDRINKTKDTAFLLQNDLSPSPDGSIDFSVFGGNLLLDNTYRFNITRHVQGIITRKEPNDTLRLYAPLRTIVFASNIGIKISVPGSGNIANGRVILGGGGHADPGLRLRLRIIYSNL